MNTKSLNNLGYPIFNKITSYVDFIYNLEVTN